MYCTPRVLFSYFFWRTFFRFQGRRRRKRTVWDKPWIQVRPVCRAYSSLISDLRNTDETAFQNYLRVTTLFTTPTPKPVHTQRRLNYARTAQLVKKNDKARILRVTHNIALAQMRRAITFPKTAKWRTGDDRQGERWIESDDMININININLPFNSRHWG